MAGETKTTTTPTKTTSSAESKPQTDTAQSESPKAKLIRETVDNLMKSMNGWSIDDQRQVLKEIAEKVEVGKVVPGADYRANRQP